MRHWVLPLVICFIAAHAQGRTWRVEKDGGGDFTVIQDCVDVSASGDTILIGSGRYNEWQMYGGNTQYPARVIIADKGLVLIGESDGSSVIGPEEPWVPGGPQHQGVVLMSDSSVVVRNLTLVNLFGGVMSWANGDFVVSDCSFLDNFYALYYQGGEGLIENCDFKSSLMGSLHVFSNFQDHFTILTCDVEQVDTTSFPNQGIVVTGCQDARIENCYISGMGIGLQFNSGTTAYVSGCQIQLISRVAVIVGQGGCSVYLVDCTISNSPIGFDSIEEGSTLSVESTILTDIELATLLCANLNEGFFRDVSFPRIRRI